MPLRATRCPARRSSCTPTVWRTPGTRVAGSSPLAGGATEVVRDSPRPVPQSVLRSVLAGLLRHAGGTPVGRRGAARLRNDRRHRTSLQGRRTVTPAAPPRGRDQPQRARTPTTHPTLPGVCRRSDGGGRPPRHGVSGRRLGGRRGSGPPHCTRGSRRPGRPLARHFSQPAGNSPRQRAHAADSSTPFAPRVKTDRTTLTAPSHPGGIPCSPTLCSTRSWTRRASRTRDSPPT